jgi:hypothetical protein
MYHFMEHMYKIGCLLFVFAGCAGEDGDDIPPDPDFPAPPPGEGIQLVSALTIAPGEEHFGCRYLVLPDSELDVARFQHHYTGGSHHMLLYPTSKLPSEVEHGALFDCRTRGDLGATGVLYGSSVPDGELPYPDGVAMRLAPRSVVLLETHYLNASDAPLDATARINLWFAQVPVETLAGTLFFRDWHIYVPPLPGTATATMRCEIPEDISLLYATSHMHRRGTAFRSTIDSTPLHDSDDWESPTPTIYWPPRDIPAGSTIEFSCDFQNDAPTPVVEGISADADEMCVLVGGYWPKLSAAAELCLLDGSGPVLAGDRSCEQTVDCMLDAGVDNWIGGQQCVAQTCADSASALSSFVVCVDLNNCWGDPGCVISKCPTQWDGCTRATCD